jgi:hypothetical protein
LDEATLILVRDELYKPSVPGPSIELTVVGIEILVRFLQFITLCLLIRVTPSGITRFSRDATSLNAKLLSVVTPLGMLHELASLPEGNVTNTVLSLLNRTPSTDAKLGLAGSTLMLVSGVY